MIKKISLATAMTMVILFSGIFMNSADAAANIDNQQNPKHNVYYSVHSQQNVIHKGSLNSYFNHFFKNWGKIYWNSKKEEQAEINLPKGEQPEQDEVAVEQPKQKTPAIQEQTEEIQNQPQEQDRPTTEVQEKEKSESNQGYQLNQFEQEVVELTNRERANNGLAPLTADWELSRVAREKSRDLATNNYFAHNSPVYGSPFDMMKAYGISYRTAGENIAKGQLTPQEVVNAWMNSPGHRANILNGNFTHIGVGYVEQGNHWTQMFIGK